MNNQIFYFFYNFAHQNVFFDWLIVFFAIYFPIIVVMIAGFFLLFYHEVLKAENPYRVFLRKKKEILLVFFSGGIAWILAVILKIVFKIPRPFVSLFDVEPLFLKSTFSFPSEHAMFYSALAFSIFFMHKKAGYIFMFFALIIGLMRVAAGVHFPIDIFVGFLLGFLVAYFIKKLFSRSF